MRIAHLSDLHVLALDGITPAQLLTKRLTGYANLKLKRSHKHRPGHLSLVARAVKDYSIDHVVITGDLTNLALEDEFDAVRALLADDLALAPEQVSVVPGNHDLYTRGAERSQRFTRYFAEFVASDLPELAADLRLGPFPYVRLRGPAAIIGLSSAVPRLPLVAAGELGRAQLTALARILEHPEVRRRTPVILVHHPTHQPPSRAKALMEGLRDADALVRVLGPVPRGLVLHGHLHRRIRQPLATSRGVLDVVGATSASLHHEDLDRIAGFNVYEIDDGGAVRSIGAEVLDPVGRTLSARGVPLGAWH